MTATAPERVNVRPEPLLEVSGLSVAVQVDSAEVPVVEDVTFSVAAGETLGVVGESGSGKTMTAMAIMHLLPPGAQITDGQVLVAGTDLTTLADKEVARFQGEQVSIVFQDATRALHPAIRVGDQIAEVIRAHHGISKRDARARAVQLLDQVGIPDAANRARNYPFEFSGGMCQRVMIAMSIANNPKVLIADEPTSALDITVQARILELLSRLRDELNLALVLISHDLAAIASVADRTAIMYSGQIVELGTTRDVLVAPRHPYTEALLASLPEARRGASRFVAIPGRVPPLGGWPVGCRFHPRCRYSLEGTCTSQPMPLDRLPGHADRCVRSAALQLDGVLR